jgi:hypothetical protein
VPAVRYSVPLKLPSGEMEWGRIERRVAKHPGRRPKSPECHQSNLGTHPIPRASLFRGCKHMADVVTLDDPKLTRRLRRWLSSFNIGGGILA